MCKNFRWKISTLPSVNSFPRPLGLRSTLYPTPPFRQSPPIMGLMKSKYSSASSNDITIDFREGDQSSSSQQEQESSSSSFSFANIRPQFQKKHSKTRLQLMKQKGSKMTNRGERNQPPAGILQKMREKIGNMMPFRRSQYQMARDEDSAHGAVMI